MSLLKTVKAMLGFSTTAANNFTLRAPDDGTFRVSRGNAGTEISDPLLIKSDNTVEVLVTPSAGDVSKKVATTEFVRQAFSSIPVRQTVLSGVTNSSGQANFISAGTGLSCNLSATAEPLLMAFASGFDTSGSVDYLEQISIDTPSYWSGLAANNLNYLYVTRSGPGSVTSNETLAPPQYGFAYNKAAQALLHFNGTVGSTTMLDDFGNTWTAMGGAKLQSNWSKFGGVALGGGGANNVLNGTTDYALNTTITSLGSGGWAMRGHVRPTSLAAAISGVFAAANAGNYGCSVTITSAGKVALYLSSNGTSWDIANATTGAATLAANSEPYIEVTFDPVAGKYFVYVNGALDQTITSSLRVCSVVSMRVGSLPLGPYYLTGYIDEFEFLPYCDHPNGTTYAVPTAPRAVSDVNYASDWFDLSTYKMKTPSSASTVAGTNPTFTISNKLYVGEAVTGASSVSSVVNYVFRGGSPQVLAPGAAPAFQARAWINFNGTGTVVIRSSGNVSSITDYAAGTYAVNFSTALPDSDYAATFGCASSAAATTVPVVVCPDGTARLPGSYKFTTRYTDSSYGLVDPVYVTLTFFR